ncbi:MAG: formate dehydrogenase accessory sulfurtransferase FdhD [Fimbriiglobus sp.]
MRSVVLGDGRADAVVVEEPLSIQLRHGPLASRQRTPFTTTLRTPGHDADLVRGLLFTERVVSEAKQILSLEAIEANHWRAELHPDVVVVPEALARRGMMSSACGLCGKLALDTLEADWPTIPPGPTISAKTFRALPGRQRAVQEVFAKTGGLHAASFATMSGEILATREDVGRHNAVDKLLGAMWESLAPVLLVSGRAGFELVQKAAIAGVPIFVAVGAPSSLAVDLAERAGITLVGFAREDRFNVYTHPERIVDWQQ